LLLHVTLQNEENERQMNMPKMSQVATTWLGFGKMSFFIAFSGFRWLFCVNVELNLSKVFGPVVCVFYCFLVGFSLEVPTLSSGGRLRSSGLPCDDGENECHSQ